MSKYRLTLIAVSAGSLVGIVCGPATAATEVLPAPTHVQVVHASAEGVPQSRAFMDEYGIPDEVQDRLLALVQNGQLPLSDTPDAVPTSEEVVETAYSTATVLHFADGSISVTEVEKPSSTSAGVGPMAVTGCSVSGGSGYANYRNCKVHYRSTVFSYGFYANFTLVQGAKNDRINSVGSHFLEYSVGHLYQTHNLTIDRVSETSSGDAVATLTITFEIFPGIGSVTRGVRIWVGNNTYWQGNS